MLGINYTLLESGKVAPIKFVPLFGVSGSFWTQALLRSLMLCRMSTCEKIIFCSVANSITASGYANFGFDTGGKRQIYTSASGYVNLVIGEKHNRYRICFLRFEINFSFKNYMPLFKGSIEGLFENAPKLI
jgi:hypothetical protein